MLKIASVLRYLSILLQIILFANSARSNNESIKLDFDTIKTIYSLKRNFNVSNIIKEITQLNSMKNDECFIDLSAITNGLENLDQWAFKSE